MFYRMSYVALSFSPPHVGLVRQGGKVFSALFQVMVNICCMLLQDRENVSPVYDYCTLQEDVKRACFMFGRETGQEESSTNLCLGCLQPNYKC